MNHPNQLPAPEGVGEPGGCPFAGDFTGRTYPFPRHRPFELPEELAWLQRNAPVAPVTMLDGREVWVVTRYDDVRAVLGDERFSRKHLSQNGPPGGANGRPPNGPASGGSAPNGKPGGKPPVGTVGFSLSIAEPPGHTRWRRIIGRSFTVRRIELLRDRVGEIAEELLDDIAAQPQPADYMQLFAARFPVRVICELFGVTAADRPQVEQWSAKLRSSSGSLAGFGETMQSLAGYASELVARRRAEPSQDVLSAIMAAEDDDGTVLTDDELVSTILFLMVAGCEPVIAQFGNSLLALFLHPDQLDRLRTDPSLLDDGADELLRYAQANTGFAGSVFAKEDVELGGATIPAGRTVYASLDCANRDETYFPDADTFDLGRPGARKHLSFSSGPHHCVGSPLVRIEMQEGIGRLLRRFPTLRLAVDPAEIEQGHNPFTKFPKTLPIVW